MKRYRNTIQVDQIREFLGALIDKNLTQGVFVTTSRFSSGAEAQAKRYSLMSEARPIRLLDADRFFDALKITMRQPDYVTWIKDTSDYPDFIIGDPVPVFLLGPDLGVGLLYQTTLCEETKFRITWSMFDKYSIRPLPFGVDWYRNEFPFGAEVESSFWSHVAHEGFNVGPFP